MFNKDFIAYYILRAVKSLQCPGSKLPSGQRRRIVRQHNVFRSRLIHGLLVNSEGKRMPRGKNMLRLRWSCKLEKSAQQWADRCITQHSPQAMRREVGENIYWSTGAESRKLTVGTDAGRSWWSELAELYVDNPANTLTRNVTRRAVLHFTQMAWGKTYEIGCGVALNCENGRKLIFVCQYNPVGNWIGDLIYELGEPCKNNEDCDTNKCIRRSGLCKMTNVRN
ncbi:unnamed protein product [Acanthocheilonema viteae]|uniref:SCP domain-containing protein n=1 Tax=Acanthocheilonema viteae TaxID=6277 RepID=A0A498SKM5_ACAVI|nr:unnamed protein product [Acanthocheilonema viteae]